MILGSSWLVYSPSSACNEKLIAELVIITVVTPVSGHNAFLGLSALDSREG